MKLSVTRRCSIIWLGIRCLCMVLVLIGSRLFAPTFLLRLTTHETTSNAPTNPAAVLASDHFMKTATQKNLLCSLTQKQIKMHKDQNRFVGAEVWSQRLYRFCHEWFHIKQAVLGCKSCVAGNRSGHFILNTFTDPSSLISCNTMI